MGRTVLTPAIDAPNVIVDEHHSLEFTMLAPLQFAKIQRGLPKDTQGVPRVATDE